MRWKDQRRRWDEKENPGSVYTFFYPEKKKKKKSELIAIDCDQTKSADWQGARARALLHNKIERCNSLSTNCRLSGTMRIIFSHLRFTSSRSHAELDSNMTSIGICVIYIYRIDYDTFNKYYIIFVFYCSIIIDLHSQWHRSIDRRKKRKKNGEIESEHWQFSLCL